jgi:hypothetical protein
MMGGVGAVGMREGSKVPLPISFAAAPPPSSRSFEGAIFGPVLLTESRERERATPRERGLGALRARSELG